MDLEEEKNTLFVSRCYPEDSENERQKVDNLRPANLA